MAKHLRPSRLTHVTPGVESRVVMFASIRATRRFLLGGSHARTGQHRRPLNGWHHPSEVEKRVIRKAQGRADR